LQKGNALKLVGKNIIENTRINKRTALEHLMFG